MAVCPAIEKLQFEDWKIDFIKLKSCFKNQRIESKHYLYSEESLKKFAKSSNSKSSSNVWEQQALISY